MLKVNSKSYDASAKVFDLVKGLLLFKHWKFFKNVFYKKNSMARTYLNGALALSLNKSLFSYRTCLPHHALNISK